MANDFKKEAFTKSVDPDDTQYAASDQGTALFATCMFSTFLVTMDTVKYFMN